MASKQSQSSPQKQIFPDGDPFPRLYQAYAHSHTEDLALWKGLAQSYGDPILELGCGPGRVLYSLAEAGFSAVGVDHEPAMLELARRRCFPRHKARVRLNLADMRDFELPDRFSLIIVPCNAFSYLEQAQALQALARIQHHLSSGGLAAFDLPNPKESIKAAQISMQSEEASAAPIDAYLEPQSGHPVQVYANYEFDPTQKRIRLTWHFDELFPDGKVRRCDHVSNYHLRSKDEMREILKKSGIPQIRFYGDYKKGPLQSHSSQMIVLAQCG